MSPIERVKKDVDFLDMKVNDKKFKDTYIGTIVIIRESQLQESIDKDII